jgi:hypothetical protein
LFVSPHKNYHHIPNPVNTPEIDCKTEENPLTVFDNPSPANTATKNKMVIGLIGNGLK